MRRGSETTDDRSPARSGEARQESSSDSWLTITPTMVFGSRAWPFRRLHYKISDGSVFVHTWHRPLAPSVHQGRWGASDQTARHQHSVTVRNEIRRHSPA